MKKSPNHRLLPKLFESLKHYQRGTLVSDLIAGITVGLVALPLAMAFAIASGVKPEAGIYTAIIAGFIVSALGGSRCQIAGPTGAFVVIVAGIVTQFGLDGLLMCTAMAGAMLVVMGLTGLGAAVRFIPRSVTIGFTNGIAILIASTQIKDFFGLAIDQVPSDFVERMAVHVESLATISAWETAVAGAALVIVLFWPRVTRHVPGAIVALIVTTLVCTLFALPVATIGSRFGGLPTGLPSLELPKWRPELFLPILPSAITVALLAAIESLLSAVVADNMTGDRHKPDMELVAQGTANLLAPLVGGIPATGAIARTATNVRAGAKSPLSGIVHALTLVTVLLVAAPLARFIPLATLAAILMVVAYNMGEWREIPGIVRLSKADMLVWATTFALTVFADLTLAVEVGMVLAALLYIHQVSETTTVAHVTPDYLKDGKPHILQDKHIPDYVTILRIHGPFLFGSTDKLEEATVDLSSFCPVVILRLRNMTALDVTGLHALETLTERLHASGRTVLICGARRQPAKILRHSDLVKLIGEKNMLPHVDAALKRAAEIHAGGDAHAPQGMAMLAS